MLVVDASVVVAALVDTGEDGTWAHELLGTDQLAAPHLMPVEVANILRRATLNGDLSADSAALAHADLLDLRVDLFPYGPFSACVWELRGNLTCYDAWYVALAEALEAPLATLDVRLSRSRGPRCRFETPGKASIDREERSSDLRRMLRSLPVDREAAEEIERRRREE